MEPTIGTTQDTTATAPPRVFQLTIPPPDFSLSRLVGIAFIALFTLVVFGVLFGIGASMAGSLGSAAPLAGLIAGGFTLLVAFGTIFWLVDRIFDGGSYRTRDRHAAYFESLARRLPVAAHAEAAAGAMARGLRSRRDMSRFLERFAPGELVLIGSGPIDLSRLPPLRDVPFEPIDLENDAEQAANLLAATTQQHSPEEDDGNDAEELSAWETLEWLAGHTWRFAFMIVALVYLGRRLWRRDTVMVFALFCIGVLIAVTAAVPLFYERRWFAAPGCLFFREHRLGRRGVRVGCVTPADTPVILDTRSGKGYVRADGRVQVFSFGDDTGVAVLIAWQSTARRPEPSEIRALLANSAAS